MEVLEGQERLVAAFRRLLMREIVRRRR